MILDAACNVIAGITRTIVIFLLQYKICREVVKEEDSINYKSIEAGRKD